MNSNKSCGRLKIFWKIPGKTANWKANIFVHGPIHVNNQYINLLTFSIQDGAKETPIRDGSHFF